MKDYISVLYLFIILNPISCGIKANYNLSGASTANAEDFNVDLFKNRVSVNSGSIVEPGVDRDLTIALQERIKNQSNLNLVNSDADLNYAGEIVEYRISPMTATAQQTAAQNRLSVAVKVRFTNNTIEDGSKDFDQRFSFFFDYPANSQLSAVKSEAHEIIFERITQDIFNASLADW